MVVIDSNILLTTILGGILSLGLIEAFGRLVGAKTPDREIKILAGVVFLLYYLVAPLLTALLVYELFFGNLTIPPTTPILIIVQLLSFVGIFFLIYLRSSRVRTDSSAIPDKTRVIVRDMVLAPVTIFVLMFVQVLSFVYFLLQNTYFPILFLSGLIAFITLFCAAIFLSYANMPIGVKIHFKNNKKLDECTLYEVDNNFITILMKDEKLRKFNKDEIKEIEYLQKRHDLEMWYLKFW